MLLDLQRSKPQVETACPGAFYPLGVASTLFLVSLALPISGDLLHSAMLRLYDAIRGRAYIFFVINFMILVILMLANHKSEKCSPESGAAPGEQPNDLLRPSPRQASPDVWYDAAPSPTFRDVSSENKNCMVIPQIGAAGVTPQRPECLPRSSPRKLYPDVWYEAESSPPFRHPSSENNTSTLPIRPKTAESAVSCLTTNLEGESSPSSPVAAASVVSISVKSSAKQSEREPGPVEEDHDSMDALWKAIAGRAPPTKYVKKNKTWDATRRAQLESCGGAAVRRALRKSETFQESAEMAASRRAVLERRMKGREVAVAADHDVAVLAADHDQMNRRFDAFIKKMNDQLRLQREESLRRYMDMVYSSRYQ